MTPVKGWLNPPPQRGCNHSALECLCPAPMKRAFMWSMLVYGCNLSTPEVKAGGSNVKGKHGI